LPPLTLDLLKGKKNVRLLELQHMMHKAEQLDYKRVSGGLLVQDEDTLTIDEQKMKIVTKRKPSLKDMSSLIFAWKVANT